MLQPKSDRAKLIYKPLDISNDRRLLRLHRDVNGEEITCGIIYLYFDTNNVNYEAVSYGAGNDC